MKKQKIATLLLTIATTLAALAQDISVSPVKVFEGATTINPVVVDTTLYFASDIKNDFLVNYFDENGNRLFQLYKVKLNGIKLVGTPTSFLSKSNRPYNQTAVAFDNSGGIHITQTNDMATTTNGTPLGIFDYKTADDESDGIASQRYKDANAAYPAYSRDGKLMIFASDAKGGYGSSDLYYCEKVNGRWSSPMNLGGVVNTRGVETSPFIHPSGKIFFASNGRSDS